ncbi:MAG: hypothetical protein ACTHKV_09050 [Flavipsychrobacter sp.]
MKQFIAIKERTTQLRAIGKIARFAGNIFNIPGEWKILLAVLLIMGLRLAAIVVSVLKDF